MLCFSCGEDAILENSSAGNSVCTNCGTVSFKSISSQFQNKQINKLLTFFDFYFTFVINY